MHTIAETLRWKTWEQQFEEYLKTRVVTDDALEEKEEGSSPPHEPVNETNNSQSISEPKNVQTLFVKPKCGNCGNVFPPASGSTTIRSTATAAAATTAG